MGIHPDKRGWFRLCALLLLLHGRNPLTITTTPIYFRPTLFKPHPFSNDFLTSHYEVILPLKQIKKH